MSIIQRHAEQIDEASDHENQWENQQILKGGANSKVTPFFIFKFFKFNF